MSELSIIILAAGKGTRMKSSTPKVLHEVAGLPMLGHVVTAAKTRKPKQLYLVTSPDQEAVRAWADERATVTHIEQKTQAGTGDAVRCCLPALATKGRVLIMFGDTPLMRADILQNLIADEGAITVAGFETDTPTGYGRIVQTEGRPQKIIEEKDADAKTRALTLCNGGIIAADASLLHDLLPQLSNDNQQGEYYLPDIVALAAQQNHALGLVLCDHDDVRGVDTQAGLAQAEAIMQDRLRAKHLENGVQMLHPQSVFFAHDTVIGKDTIIEPHVIFGNKVEIGERVRVKGFSHIEGAKLGDDCEIGPFARLRPDTVLSARVKIGNFVETKKAELAEGVKVNHLSYIGDARIGAQSNIGAGVITCNYDGVNKHLTELGENVFIGSNSSLIAPVKIGDGAYIGSSSAISKEVKADSLVITRAPLRMISDWAKKRRAPNKT